MSIRKTRFGQMSSMTLPGRLSAKCQAMTFSSRGTPHTHHDATEIAIVIAGSGKVVTDEDTYILATGDYIRIPAGIAHYMDPTPGTDMHMFIGYETQ